MRKTITFLVYAFLPLVVAAADSDLPGIDDFIDEMVTQHGFDKPELKQLFAEVEVKTNILQAISRPAEKSKPWYEYQRIFLTPEHIQRGVAFWEINQRSLAQAQETFGVLPEVIVAILGVETRYGRHMGRYRVIDSLATLAFRYPPRSQFFRHQLIEFLLLAREEKRDPRNFTGSYAGAMGLAQFMPDSFRDYAVDFDQDGWRDIWETPEDAVGSIANFLKRKGGWQAKAPVASLAEVSGVDYHQWLKRGLKPSISVGQLLQEGIQIADSISKDQLASVFVLEQEKGPEVWLGFNNFYALIRYNPSPLYAMAVYQLAKAIKAQREGRSSL
ncbi:lytic murein transglycosylase B [Nitrosococcus oceani]|uniref:Lytic murein transglycosylase B n=2 Tax=Nitrosococcus oceani TaxID=1229 RepID=Q3J7V9_NITOC|nr:lytic murein transglycosylase B [Nitrosococcus oceani]KFI18511.1 lytic murein transglycosylase [Nitrosococcus oceani C-27]ABA59087.1 Lytic murein transglycosylase B [Nitrosococcus oceani ATCC 19707]EDZ66369.1 lytic murein transglycosylase B [Nitrosococcus oceani AFC27]KFI21738.1 lytic murein transglycosylase [Nitrosococcus oceani]GEM21152.1 lytic murein transglycosylase B [Nitrosococcus oceani]